MCAAFTGKVANLSDSCRSGAAWGGSLRGEDRWSRLRTQPTRDRQPSIVGTLSGQERVFPGSTGTGREELRMRYFKKETFSGLGWVGVQYQRSEERRVGKECADLDEETGPEEG